MPHSQYASVREYADSVADGIKLEKISPADMADSINAHAEKALLKLNELKSAAGIWKRYSAMIGAMYEPQVLTRFCGKVNVQEFDELAQLDVLLAGEN